MSPLISPPAATHVGEVVSLTFPCIYCLYDGLRDVAGKEPPRRKKLVMNAGSNMR